MNLCEVQIALTWLRAQTQSRTERGATAVEYVLILLGAVAICGVAIFAVTQFVTNKGNELNGK